MWACPLAIITSSVGHKTNHTTLWSPRQARIRIRMKRGGGGVVPLMSTANFIFLYAALLPQIRHGICCTSCVSTCHSYLLHAAFLLCLCIFFVLLLRLPAERIKYEHLYNGQDSSARSPVICGQLHDAMRCVSGKEWGLFGFGFRSWWG